MEFEDQEFTPVDWQAYSNELQWLCQIKAGEFQLMGYEEVTGADIWACVLQMTKGKRALHEMVSTILGLQPGTFMHYATLSAWREGV